jgi:pSer/pThr/pTyr-binding forkhead associated (FHA) protein
VAVRDRRGGRGAHRPLRDLLRPVAQAGPQAEAAPSPAAPAREACQTRALAGTSLGLDDQQITIGRANDATLVLNDDYASTRHARLFPQDGQWIVEDLGSTNGTYLDRQKVTQPTPVPVGVPIRIGKTVLELRR